MSKYRIRQVLFFQTFFAYLVPLLLLLLIYREVGSFELVWDDTYFLKDIKTWHGGQWLEYVWAPLTIHENYFRPLVLTSWLMEYTWYDDFSAATHLGNVFFRCLNILLVGLLAQRFHVAVSPSAATGYMSALLAALIYSVHPALVESTVWASARFDLVVTTFMLLGLVAVAYLRGLGLWLALFFSFLAAALTKESAVIFPAMVFCWVFALQGVSGKPGKIAEAVVANRHLVFVIAFSGVCYLLLRYHAMGYLVQPTSSELIHNPPAEAMVAGRTFLTYLHLTFWPFDISSPLHQTEIWPLPITDFRGWLGLAALVFCFAVSGLLVCSSSWRAYGWLSLMILVSYLLLLHLLVPLYIGLNNLAAERYMTFPLAIFAVGISVALTSLSGLKIKRYLLAFVSLWLLLAVFFSIQNVSMWRSDLHLWTFALRGNPGSVQALLNISAKASEMSDSQKALKWVDPYFFEWIKKDYPEYSYAFLDRPVFGSTVKDKNQYFTELAENIKKRNYAAVQIGILNNYAKLLHHANEHLNVLFLLGIIEKLENGPEIFVKLAQTLAALGELDEAARYMRKAVELSPEKPEYSRMLEQIIEVQRGAKEAEAR